MSDDQDGTVTFHEGNTHPYMQDFAWCRGIPHDIEFEVFLMHGGKCYLVAPGYGVLGGDNYGNGCIHTLKKVVAEEREYQATLSWVL